MKVAQCSLKAGFEAHREEIEDAMMQVCRSGWYVLGENVSAFEAEFAAWCGVSGGVGVANGTDSLELILRALDLPAGSMVATVPNTAVATVSAIQRAGFEVYFIDVFPETLTMDAEQLNAALEKEKRIRAVIAVHLFGCPADLPAILKVTNAHSVPLIEDCAQSHGAAIGSALTGSFGIAGSFSFYPTKNLGALGDGGMVISNEEPLLERIRMLRQYGWKERYVSEIPGINSRLDELQSAVLRVRLKYLAAGNERRRTIAQAYTEALKNAPVICPEDPVYGKHVYHQYVVRSEKRDELREFLASSGVATALHYPVQINRQKAYRNVESGKSVPVSDRANEQILSLPMYPELTDAEVEYVCGRLKAFFA